MAFTDAFKQILEDCEKQYYTVLNQLLPFSWDYNIGSGNRRNRRNATEVHNKLVTFLQNSKDKSSLFHQMIVEEGVSLADIMNDLKGTLMAGFDTSARGTTTTIFKLLKNPV